ncbi:PREDICTED: hyaluronidase-4-like, partial [Tinamus guttatus]
MVTRALANVSPGERGRRAQRAPVAAALLAVPRRVDMAMCRETVSNSSVDLARRARLLVLVLRSVMDPLVAPDAAVTSLGALSHDALGPGAQRTLWCPCSARCPASPAPGLRHHLLLLLLLPSLWPPTAALKPALPPIVPDRPFLVAWNAPSTRCLSAYHVPLDLDAFGILVNRREAFTGGNITIFYYDQLGLYPYYQNSSVPPTAVNGGCPQNASLQDHLGKMVKDILRTMPSESFAGLAVIDWENWRPLWIRNWDKKNIYRSMSAQLVRRGNPGWSDEQVDLRAKWEFEKAAVNFMSETLKLARALRPRGWWGYYLFPDCYKYHYWDDFGGYTGHCPPLEVQRNDKLLWLWEQSRALYPSIYMEEVLRDSPQGRRFVGAKLREALRVAELPSAPHSLPVFAYARPFYTYTLKELSQAPMGQAAAAGAHGVVLWGDVEYSRNRSNCQKIRNYLLGALGPYIVNVTLAAPLCSPQLCP